MGHRLECLGNGEYLGAERDTVTDEMIRIPGAVEALVVRADDPARFSIEPDRRKQALADRGVSAQGSAFCRDQLSRQAHLFPVEKELTDVVQARGFVEVDHLRRGHPDAPADRAGRGRDATRVTLAAGVDFDRAEERLEDHASGVTNLFPDASELFSPGVIRCPFGTIQAAQCLIGCMYCLSEDASNAALHIPVSHVCHARARRSLSIAEE